MPVRASGFFMHARSGTPSFLVTHSVSWLHIAELSLTRSDISSFVFGDLVFPSLTSPGWP